MYTPEGAAPRTAVLPSQEWLCHRSTRLRCNTRRKAPGPAGQRRALGYKGCAAGEAVPRPTKGKSLRSRLRNAQARPELRGCVATRRDGQSSVCTAKSGCATVLHGLGATRGERPQGPADCWRAPWATKAAAQVAAPLVLHNRSARAFGTAGNGFAMADSHNGTNLHIAVISRSYGSDWRRLASSASARGSATPRADLARTGR